MARYIDADAMSIYFDALIKHAEAERLYNMAHVYERCLHIVKDAPTADVAPRAEWISVEERLPEEGKYVIVWVGSAQVARIEKGITEEERQKMKNGEVEDIIEYGWSQSTGFMPLKRSNLYKACDVHGNNRVPYCWKANGGPIEWFGQNVTHWMPLPEPPKGDAS
jgi:hypothetical protein